MPAGNKPSARFPELEPINHLLRSPPITTEDYLVHVRALGSKIEGYIKFICAVSGPNRASEEAREKAVRAFYERLHVLEQELRRVHDAFQLQ
jgi:hypothetical protein